jgi:hypothetical protein
MIPVDMTIYDAAYGNCLNASVASILEVAIDDVPGFVDGNPDDWFEKFAAWLVDRGYAAAHIPNTPAVALRGYHVGVCDYHEVDGELLGHAIVALDGKPVHCPSKCRSGLTKPVRYWIALVPLGGTLTVERAA